MSTCNFSQPNLSRIYAIALGNCDEWQYDDEKENIQNELENLKGYNRDESKYIGRDRLTLGYFHVDIWDKMQRAWYAPRIYITVEAGYYEGAMIDADFSEIEEYAINKTAQARIDAIKKRVEKILSMYTTKLRRVAVFSNGEAIYERA